MCFRIGAAANVLPVLKKLHEYRAADSEQQSGPWLCVNGEDQDKMMMTVTTIIIIP